jgi:hypothetical protein
MSSKSTSTDKPQRPKNKKYRIRHRLEDVVRLISVLSLHTSTFLDLNGINRATRGNPISADTWFKIAIEHPEFFRFNGDEKFIALLLRSYLPIDTELTQYETRIKLTLEETQKLIDVALELHDRERERGQRLNVYVPLVSALIAGALGCVSTLAGIAYSSRVKSSPNQHADSIQISQPHVELPASTGNNKR